MTKEIYISSTPHETRLAVVEDDQLAEIYYERENEYTLAGSVYKGKVTRVLPGMQSAFVDIGLERDAFLYVTDFAEESEDGEEYVALTQGQATGRNPASSVSNGHAAEPQARTSERQQHGGNPPRREDAGPPRASTESTASTQGTDETGAGAKRWRGRRGRRRGRNNGPTQNPSTARPAENGEQQDDSAIRETGPMQPEPVMLGPDADDFEPADPTSGHLDQQQAESPSERPRQSHTVAPQTPAMVLPGESLSKYRSGPAATRPATDAGAKEAPVATAPASSYRPPTMVTGPLAWDGSDVLPGESLSRYKNKPREDHGRMNADAPALPPTPASTQAETRPATEETLPAPDAPEPGAAALPPSAGDALQPGTAQEQLAVPETTQTLPVQEQPVQEHSAHEQPAEFEPVEGSASYRFDPSTPSAYRQNFGLESAVVQADPPVRSLEESYPVTASQPSEEHAPDTPEWTAETTEEADAAEPFLGESVSIAPHPHHPAHHQPAATEPSEFHADPRESSGNQVDSRNRVPAEENWPEAEDAGAPVDEEANAHTLHAFDPGLGNLEEEMIDEEEAEAFAAQTLLEEAEYDDLVEETMDMQMDSGLLSELVRDRHIEQRTRYVEGPGGDAGSDETMLDEDDAEDEAEEESLDDPSTALEFESVSDASSDEDVDESAPARSARPDAQRSQRRGMRGQQRQGQRGDRGRMRRATAQTSNLPAITELLKPNQEILVQIAKEPIARKGARITSHIALPGRFLVFMPTVNHVGVSRKISSDEERQRLKRILLSEKGTASGGFIVRTAAASASEEDLRADIRFLLTLWAEMRQRAEGSKPPALIYHDLSLVERVLRDQVTDNFSAIWVDSEADYERVLRFLNRFEPALVRRVKLYTKETPLFEQFGIQEEINKALRSKVWLKSGGSIVINQTEALVAIDINTGKYVGKTARLEDTILKTNLDAIPEIVRQIRLRDLGGIIVIDFIDMDERKNRNKVMQALEEELKADRAPSKVLQFNDFGLVAITRKRVKQSLERTLSVPCSICTGTGMVKGPLTVCNEIYIELRKMHRQFDRADVMLRVHPEVVKQLKTSNGRWLSEMEEMSGKTIIVKSDAALHPEQFDIH